MGDELVVEDGGVDLDLNEVNSDCGDLGDHDAAESIGHGGVGVAELEFRVVVFQLPNFHLWETLVGNTFHAAAAAAASVSPWGLLKEMCELLASRL